MSRAPILVLLLSVPCLADTPKKPVTDTYHGVTVTDDYRWLENTADPAVKAWIEAQNKAARVALDKVPFRNQLRDRLHELISAPSTEYSGLKAAGGQVFALKSAPPHEQPFLVVLPSVREPEKAHTVVDPGDIDKKGKTAIDFYVPSPDGKLVAVSLSENGSEAGTLHLFDVASGKKLDEVIPRVIFPTGGGDVAWNGDGTGFYYTRYPAPGERPDSDLQFFQQVYFHKIGTPVKDDTYSIGKEFPRIAETQLQSSADGDWLLVTIQNGDGGEFEHYLKDRDGNWKQLTKFADRFGLAAFGQGSDKAVYFHARKDAPRGQIVRVPLDNLDMSKAQVVVPQGEAAIDGLRFNYTFHTTFVPTAGGLYVLDSEGGPSRLRFLPHGGKEEVVPLPPVSAVKDVAPLGGDDVLIEIESYTLPPAWFSYSHKTRKLEPTPLARQSPVSFDDIEVVREFATSKDGTKVPLSILYRKGTQRNGTNPTLLTGYGGFGLSQTPRFALGRRVWLEQGGVIAVANLRGGGEYGEEWRAQGNKTHKQNVFDDFAACAQLLIDHQYTCPAKLAIEGGSNGGLLMGAALTQHPELFRAVVSHVGLYDMLRFENHPNGLFNVTEYGTVKDPEQFRALYAYSPYHHVQDGTKYPAVFLLTGLNDGRVDPAHTLKMAARLQAATASKHPILVLTDAGSGHGIGDAVSTRVDKAADVYAFLFDQLGMTYTPVKKTP
ncbi:MAG: prolyl oligopeptidase family serine peptidase [Gemmataceae bacterium]